MPKLVDLDPHWVKLEIRRERVLVIRPGIDPTKPPAGGWRDEHIVEVERDVSHHVFVDSFAEADGIWFDCPYCFVNNGGSKGTHAVLCWFVGKVPPHVDPKPGRWVPRGTTFADLSFVGPASASVRLTGGCRWHGHISNGQATILGDSGPPRPRR